jgi:hypothetical protein
MDRRAASEPTEKVFRAKSLWHIGLTLMAIALAAAACALELGFGERLRTVLNVTPTLAQEIAWAAGGVAALVFVCVAWEWFRELRWVAVSQQGLRWFRGGRVHDRTWSELAGVQRRTGQVFKNGQHIRTAYGAEVRFHHGPPLFLAPTNVHHYEQLVSEIESKTPGRADDRCAAPDDVRTFGPLQLDPRGVEWDGVHFTWDRVRSYQVEHGYLLIQAEDGSEFLKRLADLGEWQPALDRLEINLADKRVSAPASPSPELTEQTG